MKELPPRYAPQEMRSDPDILARTAFGSPPRGAVLRVALLSGRSYTRMVHHKRDSLDLRGQKCRMSQTSGKKKPSFGKGMRRSTFQGKKEFSMKGGEGIQ